MSLLNRILKTKSTEETLADRITSLTDLGETELFELAISSTEVKLQQEAINKLGYGQPLLKLALGDHPARLSQAACQHIGALLEKDERLIAALFNDTQNQAELMHLIAYSQKAIDKALVDIRDEKILSDIALNGKTSPLRQQAAEKISLRENLDPLLHAAKEKDRSVFKIVKAKLNEFKAEEQALSQRKMQAETLCVDLDRILKRDIDESYKSRLSQIEETWQQYSSEEKSACEERFQLAHANCRNKLESHLAAEAAERALADDQEQAKQDLRAATIELCRLAGKLYQAEAVNSELESFYNNLLHNLGLTVNSIIERDFPLGTELEKYNQAASIVKQLWLDMTEHGTTIELIQSLEALQKQDANVDNLKAQLKQGEEAKQKLNRLLQHKVIFSKNGLNNEIPEIVSKSTDAISGWVAARREENDKRKKQITKFNDLIRKATQAINSGHVRQARGIARELEEKQKKYVGLPQDALTKLAALEEKMAKLGDWHDFAVQPKKQALVEKMEALVGSSLHPSELAEVIKSMRSEWKLLCKGGENQDKDLWDRMQAAAEKAYEPCRQYFDEKTEEREQNFAKREELIAQMNHYYTAYSWDNAVWKDVEQTLKAAREAWQNCWPIPRKGIKVQQNTFNSIMDKIHSKIKEANQTNQDAKNALIEKAKVLIEQEDILSAINTAKQLQAQWKQLGGVVGAGRKEEQKLWEKFRGHCNAVFEKRESEFAELNNMRSEELSKAKAIIAKLDDILSKTGLDFNEAKSGVKEIIAEFNTVGELPKNEQNSIRDLFNKKLNLIEDKGRQERKAAIKQSWDALFNIANEIRIFEELVLKGAETSETLENLKEHMKSIENWPTQGQATIEKRLENAQNLDATAMAENDKALRTLCIRAEIIKGVGSPEEDKALRMEYQIQLLQQGYGIKNKIADTPESLVMDWIAIPAVAESAYIKLTQRFRTLVQY